MCMTQDIRKTLNLLEDRTEDLDKVDKDLYNYVHNELGWPGSMERLHQRYPLTVATYCFRGMNFDTQEQYDAFVAQVKSGQVQVSSSSWSPVKGTAEQFAQFKQTYHLSAAVAHAHGEYEKSKEAIHGHKGVLLGMMITPDMKAVDVREFKHGAEEEILLPGGTYELKIIKEFGKFADTIDMKSIDSEFINAEPNSRKYEHIWSKYKDQLSPKARVKHLINRLAGVFHMKALFSSRTEEIKNIFDRMHSSYFDEKMKFGLFPIDLLELANASYFPAKYNSSVIKMANASANRFIKEYSKNPKVVVDNYDIGRVHELFRLLDRDAEFNEVQRDKFHEPYKDMQTRRVKDINKLKDPQQRKAAMDQYIHDIKDMLGRI